MKRNLTPRQRQIFDFVVRHINKFSFPPTRREICDEFGFKSCNAAQQHLELIEHKGWLHIVRGKVSRGIIIA